MVLPLFDDHLLPKKQSKKEVDIHTKERLEMNGGKDTSMGAVPFCFTSR